MDFKAELEKRTSEINRIISGYLPEQKGFQKIIFEAMGYSISAGGKRIRPMLMQETYRLFGGSGDEIYPFMAAIEMIHTYSLVHDDLPAMDDDEYRRGKKSTHAQFGEAIGILTGDALLNYAFETMAAAVRNNPCKETAEALLVISKKAGVNGMIGGQTVDVISEGEPLTKEKLLFIHENKTSALIEASMMTGAILSKASESDIKKIEQIAKNIGIAFQIQDDLLDVLSSTEELGKPIGSDEKNDKTTYVTLFGIETAKDEVKKLTENAIDILDSFDNKNPFLRALILALVGRKK